MRIIAKLIARIVAWDTKIPPRSRRKMRLAMQPNCQTMRIIFVGSSDSARNRMIRPMIARPGKIKFDSDYGDL